ncbi:MAG: 50S ribosomal protein L25 [Akkermansia sp.]
MATSHSIKAEKRTEIGSGKLNQLRREGFIPCVVYGAGLENTNIKVNAKEFTKMLASAASEHILVNLDMEGSSKLALLKDFQHSTLSGKYVHVDFLEVNDNTEVHSSVPVHIEGEAIGLASGGLLDQPIHELQIKCKVKDLPEAIVVDVTNLKVGDAIRIAELTLPAGVIALIADDTIIVSVDAPNVKTEEEEVAEATAAAASEEAANAEEKPAK